LPAPSKRKISSLASAQNIAQMASLFHSALLTSTGENTFGRWNRDESCWSKPPACLRCVRPSGGPARELPSLTVGLLTRGSLHYQRNPLAILIGFQNLHRVVQPPAFNHLNLCPDSESTRRPQVALSNEGRSSTITGAVRFAHQISRRCLIANATDPKLDLTGFVQPRVLFAP
jgi:hypothetical protein